jgi:hypothetical protein
MSPLRGATLAGLAKKYPKNGGGLFKMDVLLKCIL